MDDDSWSALSYIQSQDLFISLSDPSQALQ